MNILEQLAAQDHEQVIAFQNRATGLRGFLALHDTTRGPALGGVRLWPYSSEEEALADALQLARAMTYKAALAELPCGGGKAVLLAHAGLKRAEAFEAFGHLVESLHGRFFTGCDLGTDEDDLQAVRRVTSHVACAPAPGLGDLAEHTAQGLWHGLRACLEFAGLGTARVAIQGVGSVGLALGQLLKREELEITVADADAARARRAQQELGARLAPPDEILTTPCEVLAPCALGGVLNAEMVPRLRARIVCGSANNILATPETGDELARRGILYAPDYLVNAGGLIRGAEFYLLKRADSAPSLARIYDRMRRVLEIARERGVSTARVADELAEARFKKPKTYRELSWDATGPSAGKPSCES
ncbi:MAG: Glu/Leu/Phe/Val dehydrogenase dimerization domain-containing protein [Terriglobia bacterium]